MRLGDDRSRQVFLRARESDHELVHGSEFLQLECRLLLEGQVFILNFSEQRFQIAFNDEVSELEFLVLDLQLLLLGSRLLEIQGQVCHLLPQIVDQLLLVLYLLQVLAVIQSDFLLLLLVDIRGDHVLDHWILCI